MLYVRLKGLRLFTGVYGARTHNPLVRGSTPRGGTKNQLLTNYLGLEKITK